MFRKIMPAVLVAMVCLCLFTAACGNSVPAANNNNDTISVEIANNTENITIAFALFFGPDLDTWGENMLAEDMTIDPGEVLAVELPRSTYDLSLMTYENYVVKSVFSIGEDARVEVGGERGRAALNRLKNAIGRVEASWRPASPEESFEIVRRRLFDPIADPSLFVSRDQVARSFSEMYGSQQQEFPSDCREGRYERRIKAAYPIHPELFDRLYEDWSTLDKFQRTRGVLRLMASVIHSLWERQDSNLLIMPSNVPIDDQRVRFELTRYLEEQWDPVIERDVDGQNSLPLALDRDNPC